MKITHSLISAACALAFFAGSAAPAFAYRFTPPVATTTLPQKSEVRELYADADSSILELASVQRSNAVSDTTGRSMLARAQTRIAQRNFRRHVLGYLRGVDYRILNTSGASQRFASMKSTSLPSRLVQTGGGETKQNFRPNARNVRNGGYYGGCVVDRNRDIFSC